MLLVGDRLVWFERQVGLFGGLLGEELGRWVGEAGVEVDGVWQVSGFAGLGLEGFDVAVVRCGSGVGVVGVELGLGLGLVDVLCGGGGFGGGAVRGLSRLEMGVLDLVLLPVVAGLGELFGLGGVGLGAHVLGVDGLPGGKVESVVGFGFSVSVGGVEGRLVVGLPGSVLQGFLDVVDRRIAGEAAAGGGVVCGEIVRAVGPVAVELVAGFEVLRVPAGELVGLRVGDVLRTGQSVGRPLVARVGEERLFHFRPGAQGQRLVAEVTGHITNTITDTVTDDGVRWCC